MKKSRSRATRSSGSSAHRNERSGAGPAGAGEVATGGPGKAAGRVRPHISGAQFEGGANSYSPKGMKTYSEE